MLNSLTGLRFYAALLVCLSHLYLFGYCFGITQGPVYHFLDALGQLGVSLFFVLSGFILYVNYLGPNAPKRSVYEFYIARFARIYPVFIVTTLMALPITLFSHDFFSTAQILVPHLGMAHCFYPKACTALNSPGWSISVEFFFYLVFPLLGLLFKGNSRFKIGLFLLVYFLGLVAARWLIPTSFYSLPTFPLVRIAEFLLGMGVGHLFAARPQCLPSERILARMSRNGLLYGIILAAFFGMVLQPILWQKITDLQGVFYLFYAPFSAVIILLLALMDRHNLSLRVLTEPLILLGGEISYSFYLIHHLVMRYVLNATRILFHIDLAHTQSFFPVAAVLVSLLVAMGLSLWMYRFVEVPCRRLLLHYLKPLGYRSESLASAK